MTDKDLAAFFGLELAKMVVDECLIQKNRMPQYELLGHTEPQEQPPKNGNAADRNGDADGSALIKTDTLCSRTATIA